jgi:hypothetical protein
MYIAKSKGYSLYALSFDYGQRHAKEIDCAHDIALAANVREHRVIHLPKPKGSALTEAIEVPVERNLEQMAKEIPVTYVPARNTLFIAHKEQPLNFLIRHHFSLTFVHSSHKAFSFVDATVVTDSGLPMDGPSTT